jgi:glycosyltransferase involved in cell wall biosynthesis
VGPDQVTPLILTYDEAPNIRRVLNRLAWAARIVVVDSGSADGTLNLLSAYSQVEVFHRPFDDHTAQWNFGLDQVQTEWVLTLDADYVLGKSLVEEIKTLDPSAPFKGYEARFRYCIGGRPLRGTLYPPRVVLFRTGSGRYVQDGHTQRLHIEDKVGTLRSPIYHDDRKSLGRWLANQRSYAALEADKLLSTPPEHLGRADRLRRRGWIVPLLTPLYCLFGKGLLLDGHAGLAYTLQRTYAEVLLALELTSRAWKGQPSTDKPAPIFEDARSSG